DGVVAAQFEIFQAAAAAQRIVGEIEDMVGLVIRQMDLERVQPAVDDVRQAEALHEEMDGADATATEPVAACAEFVVDVACGKLRVLAVWQLTFVEAALDASLAVAPASSYAGSHSKSLLASGDEIVDTSSNLKKPRGFRVFCFPI